MSVVPLHSCLSWLCPPDLREDALQVKFFIAHICNLLWSRGLALNADSALVTQRMQAGKNLQKVHVTLADQNFLTQSSGIGWPLAVFGMHRLYICTEYLDCVYRVRLSVKNQVCRIQSNADVRPVYILYGTQHRDRRFLP